MSSTASMVASIVAGLVGSAVEIAEAARKAREEIGETNNACMCATFTGATNIIYSVGRHLSVHKVVFLAVPTCISYPYFI